VKHCTCCHSPLRIAECINPRPWVLPFLYGIIAECPNCAGTQCFMLHEVPDELLLVDGELSSFSHERDARETEAA
jgi:hypothetical protein